MLKANLLGVIKLIEETSSVAQIKSERVEALLVPKSMNQDRIAN